jgi:hypothetical protein
MKTSFGEPNPFAQPDSRGGGAALILQVTDLEEGRQVVDLCADVIVAQGHRGRRDGARRSWSTLTPSISQAGALFVTHDTRWDRALKVTGDGEGLVGHAGAVLLRKLADQAGLTAGLGSALARAGKFPLVDRGVALVSMAVAIVLGATSMSDIAVLAHQELVLGAAPGDTTVRRTLELADPATLGKITRVRARVRAHVWSLAAATPAGFPWLAVAGKLLAGWLVIDLDATLITAHSEKQGAAPTFKKGYGFHPLGAWLANTAESLAMLLRPGNAGSNTFADHAAVLTAAIGQIPAASAPGCWCASTGPAPATS